MKTVLIVGNNCSQCDEAKENLKELIDKGDVEVKNLEDDVDTMQLWLENELEPAPCLVVITSDGDLFAKLDIAALGT